MQKYFSILAVILLSIVSTVSFAATQSFWAYGSNDDAYKAKFLNSTGSEEVIKNISIAYALGNNWRNITAKLWLRAVDDSFNESHCMGYSCADGTGFGKDASEQAEITKIEGRAGLFSSTEINAYGWYDLNLDVTSYLLADKDSVFTAKLKAALSTDFYFKNAKLVVDYNVPIPAAAWLFGSALLGLACLKRKPLFAKSAQ